MLKVARMKGDPGTRRVSLQEPAGSGDSNRPPGSGGCTRTPSDDRRTDSSIQGKESHAFIIFAEGESRLRRNSIGVRLRQPGGSHEAGGFEAELAEPLQTAGDAFARRGGIQGQELCFPLRLSNGSPTILILPR
jgi:hypothetical protein